MATSSDAERVQLTVGLPATMRTALMAEADRRGVPPSLVVEDLLRRYLPRFVADSLRQTFTSQEAS